MSVRFHIGEPAVVGEAESALRDEKVTDMRGQGQCDEPGSRLIIEVLCEHSGERLVEHSGGQSRDQDGRQRVRQCIRATAEERGEVGERVRERSVGPRQQRSRIDDVLVTHQSGRCIHAINGFEVRSTTLLIMRTDAHLSDFIRSWMRRCPRESACCLALEDPSKIAVPQLTSDLPADQDLTDAFVSGLIAKAGRALVLTRREHRQEVHVEADSRSHTVLGAPNINDDLKPAGSGRVSNGWSVRHQRPVGVGDRARTPRAHQTHQIAHTFDYVSIVAGPLGT